MSQTNEFTENDLLDEYFKQQKQKILDNKNYRMNDQYDEFENYQTQPEIKQISIKNIFNKDNITLEQNIANLRKQKNFQKKHQKQVEQINQQHNKMKNLKNISILDLQLKKMNEIIKQENLDEKLLYTVKASMQDKYISKHLQAQLGSLNQYMEINKIYEPSEDIQQKTTIEKTKTKEEIEKDQKRIQIIQQNPLKILSNDPEFNNKIDAANLLMDNLLLKTFGISDIKKLKAETLEQLNFDRSNTLRLKEIQQNQLIYSLYNLNKRNNNFNDFFENKIDRLIDKNDRFRSILESKNPFPVDQNSTQNNRNKVFNQQNSILNNKQIKKTNTNNLSQQQSFQRQKSTREILTDNQQQHYQENQNDNIQFIQQLINKNQKISQFYQIYLQNKSEIDEQTRQLIKQIQKPKFLNLQSVVSSISNQNITVQTQLEMQNKENQIKEVLELNSNAITMKNIILHHNNILSIFTSKNVLENIKILEMNKVEMNVSMLDFILQILMITNNCIEQLFISNMTINNNLITSIEQLLMLVRIQSLTLSNVMLNDKQLIQLAKPIISNNTLVTLDVSNNLLDDQIIYTIFLLVKYTPNLQNINLAGNNNITIKEKLQHIYKQNINIFI